MTSYYMNLLSIMFKKNGDTYIPNMNAVLNTDRNSGNNIINSSTNVIDNEYIFIGYKVCIIQH